MRKCIALVLAFVCMFGAVGCFASRNDNISDADEVKFAMIPMVKVNGVLYLDTGHNNTDIGKCGTLDGEITSTVDGSEKPTADNQSNFGAGYGYQYGAAEGTIELYMNDKWRIFAAEEVRQQIQFPEKETETVSFQGRTFSKDDLSQETIDWLAKYSKLSKTEQLSISSIPSDLYELCGYVKAEDLPAVETDINN